MEILSDYWSERFLSCKGDWGNIESTIRLIHNLAHATFGSDTHIVIAGGSFASLYINGNVKDFDIFIYKGEYYTALEKAVVRGSRLIGHKKNSSIFQNDSILFELVRCEDTPIETIKGFDFEHCKSFYDGVSFDIRKDLIENKQIIICDNAVDPYNSVKNSSSYRRLVKLLRGGWVLKDEVKELPSCSVAENSFEFF